MKHIFEQVHAHQAIVLWGSVAMMLSIIAYALVDAFSRVS